MKMVYLKFKQPIHDQSLTSKQLEGKSKNLLLEFITKVLPKANPDFDSIIDTVDYWKIEYDPATQLANREIGLNREGKPIVKMPFGNNYGYWSDTTLSLEEYGSFQPEEITKEEFESDWKSFPITY